MARSGTATVPDTCFRLETPKTFFDDPALPPPGGVFHYLNRSLTPHTGSWGSSSAGERPNLCA